LTAASEALNCGVNTDSFRGSIYDRMILYYYIITIMLLINYAPRLINYAPRVINYAHISTGVTHHNHHITVVICL
jgi:hypothetical protein